MTPKINIDGSSVSSITIDGTDVSEVTVDGDVVFSISAIPDSVVERWPIKDSSFPLENSVGTSDFTAVGAPTIESDSNSIEGDRVYFDGSDDGADTTATTVTGSITMPVTLEWPNTISSGSNLNPWGTQDSGTSSEARVFRLGANSDNDIQFTVVNDSGTRFSVFASGATNTRYRLAPVLDTNAGELRLGKNGTIVDTTAVSGSFTTTDVLYLGREGGNNRRWYEGYLDEPMVDETGWSNSQVQADYDRQPWS